MFDLPAMCGGSRIAMRLLFVEDSPDDAELIVMHLEEAGLDPEWTRVQTAEAMGAALAGQAWDAVLADLRLPAFSAYGALDVLQVSGLDLPFIVVSGTIGEEAAAGLMLRGAHDYVSKQNLSRLAAAIRREIENARHRRVERAARLDLERSERKFRTLFEQAADLIAVIDLEGRFVDANEYALALTGYRRDEISRLRIRDLFSEEELAANPIRYADMAAGGTVRSVRTIRCRNGQPITIEVSAKLLPDGHVLMIGRDVTAQTEARLALESHARQQAALASLGPIALASLNPDEMIRTACRSVAETLNVDLAGVVRLAPDGSAFELVTGHGFDPDISARHARTPMAASQAAFTFRMNAPVVVSDWERETRFVMPALLREHHVRSGVSVVIEGREAPWGVLGAESRNLRTFTREDGLFLCSVANLLGEAIERCRFEAERVRLARELEQANRFGALGTMAATLAHEFNNVLMGIQPFAEILERSAADAAATSAVQHIRRSVRRGRRVTEEVLRFGHTGAPLKRRIVAASFLASVAGEARALMPPGITVELACEGPPVEIEGDLEQLTQVFLNLAVNARDAMGQEGRIRLVVAPSGAHDPCAAAASSSAVVHIVMADSGPGIPHDVLERVFEPFYTTKRQGTGLGLPVAKQIIDGHGGHLFLASRPGVGTEVHVLLPIAPAEARSPEPDAREEPAGARVSSVLLVDDEELITEGLTALLASEGIETFRAGSGTAAMAAVADRRPEAVILDVGLPDIPGTEVFERLRERWPEVPVIFATGHGDERRLAGYLALTRVAFLRKPFELEALLRALRRVTEPQSTVIAKG